MLLTLDDDFSSGRASLYPWQNRILKDFAKPSNKIKPYKAVLNAANGSGKDSIIIASCAVWLSMNYEWAQTVITSKSGLQLDRQTCRQIIKMCNAFNAKFKCEAWQLNFRKYTFTESNSVIDAFSTDEAGRAEGWHPLKPDSQFAIFCSEAKSIEEEIFDALHRCTGFSKRVDVSSPGLPMGHFYNSCCSPYWIKYKVTAYDCPHLGRDYIEETRQLYGEQHYLFKSMILAEFGSTEDMVVIPYHFVHRCSTTRPYTFLDGFNTAGLDLSGGGAEQVLFVRNGNKFVGMKMYHMDDTDLFMDQAVRDFADFELDNPKSLIFGDGGGLGEPILNILKNKRGWLNIRKVLNQGSPSDKRAYYNRGAENWFNMRRLIEKCEVDISTDPELIKQLSSRYYKITQENKALLESKEQARSKGHCSPDRADAAVLCYSNYKTRIELPTDAVEAYEKLANKTSDPSSFNINVRPVIRPSDIVKERNNFSTIPKGCRDSRIFGGGSLRQQNAGIGYELLRLDIEGHNDLIRSGKKK